MCRTFRDSGSENGAGPTNVSTQAAHDVWPSVTPQSRSAFRLRVVAAVLAPHVVDGHHVVATVGVAAGKEVDVQRLQHHADVLCRPHACSEHEVGAVPVTRDEVHGQLHQHVRVHQLPGVHSSDKEDPTPPLPCSGAEP